MKKIIQVRVSKGESQLVGDCIDLPIVSQAKTLDELSRNLQEAVALHLEGENLLELGIAKDPVILMSFEIEPALYAKA